LGRIWCVRGNQSGETKEEKKEKKSRRGTKSNHLPESKGISHKENLGEQEKETGTCAAVSG